MSKNSELKNNEHFHSESKGCEIEYAPISILRSKNGKLHGVRKDFIRQFYCKTHNKFGLIADDGFWEWGWYSGEKTSELPKEDGRLNRPSRKGIKLKKKYQ